MADPSFGGEALPQNSPFAHRSRRVEQADELALVVVADFLDRERVFALAQQQELVGPHPHDFVGRGKRLAETCALTFSEAFPSLKNPIGREVEAVSYSIVVSPIVRESMSAVA